MPPAKKAAAASPGSAPSVTAEPARTFLPITLHAALAEPETGAFDSEDAYLQTLQEGATFLAGCPEEALIGGVPACPDHWTFMVSPTIGTHVQCTAQDAAEQLGMTVSKRNSRCGELTALDGGAAPAEAAGAGLS